MGNFHTRHKVHVVKYKKLRRCSRILEKFYDAKYVDLRDGTVKAGKELGSGRINRREPRVSAKSLRKYRGHKVSKGRRTVRRQRYAVRPGTVFLLDGKRLTSRGVQHYGKYVTYRDGSGKTISVAVKKITVVHQPGGWEPV